MEKISNLIDFCLSYTDENINWDKVIEVYGEKTAEEIKTFRRIRRGE